MEKSFPVILSELRKEKGISQKEASEKLGVSQALLSHYEKGIRECGQSFLIKAADFYGVTCDYLLGRSTDKQGIKDFENMLEIDGSDTLPIRKTLIKAICQITAELEKNTKNDGLELDKFIAAQLYKLILLEAKAGNLPKNWAGKAYVDGEVNVTELYLNLVDRAAASTVRPVCEKSVQNEEPMPEALRTLVKESENGVMSYTIDKMPPIPLELIK